MSLDTQAVIAIVTLIVSCPLTLWLLHFVYRCRRGGGNESKHQSKQFENANSHVSTGLLPLHVKYLGASSTMMVYRQQRVWSFESEHMIGPAAVVDTEPNTSWIC
jgi:hypothetical protein